MPVPPPADAKKVFEGILAHVYQWPQKMFDGTTRTFECYVRHDTTAIIAFLDPDTILLTKQEQPSRPPFFDVPGGRVDPGETVEEGAIREFKEEAGYTARRMELWTLKSFTGLSRFQEAIYVATDLTKGDHINHDAPGEKIDLLPMKFEEVVTLCLQDRVRRPEVALAILAMHYDPEAKARLRAFLKNG